MSLLDYNFKLKNWLIWTYDFVKDVVTRIQIRMRIGKLFSLFLIQNMCSGYSKEPSLPDSSFEYPKHMLKLMGKEIIKILGK